MTEAVTLNRAGRMAFIDGMRAFAVMLVVVAHAGLGGIVPGGSGVTIFFTVSGFIISTVIFKQYDSRGEFEILGFYIKRVLKLAPPFVVIILIPTAIYSIYEYINWSGVLAQTFFYYNWMYMHPGAAVLPGSGVVWSLSIEEQFYLGFAAVWLILIRFQSPIRSLVLIATCCALTSLIVRIIITAGGVDHARTYYGTDTRIDGIVIGVLAAILYREFARSEGGHGSRWVAKIMRITGSPWLFFAAAAAYTGSLVLRDEFFRETFRYSIQAVAAAAILLYGLTARRNALSAVLEFILFRRAVQVVGLASYSIYLSHFVAMSFFNPTVDRWPSPLVIALRIALSLAIGIGAWIMVERPIEKRKNQIAAKLGARRIKAKKPSATTTEYEAV